MTAPLPTGPFLGSCALLGVAGAAKVLRPGDTAAALRQAGLPVTRSLVRAGAALEVAVALSALSMPGLVTGAAVAGSFAAFGAFVVLALWKGWPIASCGCFGQPDTPPTATHALLNLGAAAFAGWWASAPAPSLTAVFSGPAEDAVSLGVLSGVIALLALAAFSDRLGAARRSATSPRAETAARSGRPSPAGAPSAGRVSAAGARRAGGVSPGGGAGAGRVRRTGALR